MIIRLPKPQITDSDSWWTGRKRIATFASFMEALEYWERGDIETTFTFDDMMKSFNAGRSLGFVECGEGYGVEWTGDPDKKPKSFNEWVTKLYKK